MHERGRSNNACSVDSANCLVAKADPHDGDLAGQFLNRRHGDTCILGATRSRRDQKAVGREAADLLAVNGVITKNLELSTEFAQFLDEVVGEGVVVVDNYYPDGHGSKG